MLYRRGFATFTVTVSRLAPACRSISDVTGRGWQDVVLTDGYLKGTAARTFISDSFVYETRGISFSSRTVKARRYSPTTTGGAS